MGNIPASSDGCQAPERVDPLRVTYCFTLGLVLGYPFAIRSFRSSHRGGGVTLRAPSYQLWHIYQLYGKERSPPRLSSLYWAQGSFSAHPAPRCRPRRVAEGSVAWWVYPGVYSRVGIPRVYIAQYTQVGIPGWYIPTMVLTGGTYPPWSSRV